MIIIIYFYNYYYHYYYLLLFQSLIKKMGRNYRCVKCSTFLEMMNDIGIDKKQQLCI